MQSDGIAGRNRPAAACSGPRLEGRLAVRRGLPLTTARDGLLGLAPHGLTDPKARRTDVGRLSPSDLPKRGIPHTHACLDTCLSRLLRKVMVVV